MTTARILIVGAGALGLTCAYHLSLAGASITFLVRSHRVADLSRPQLLYRYNDHSLKTFEQFDVLSDLTALRGQDYDFVLLTMDGATCRSQQGTATLKGLGHALAGSGARLMINAVGIGLYEYVKEVTGLADTQLMQGTMGIFAYQPGRPNTPCSNILDKNAHDKADIAYLNFPEGIDFLVVNKPKKAARVFKALFNQCGVARCTSMPEAIFKVFSNSFFPFTVASEIDGWQGTEHLINNTELWQLCCQTRREIMGLKRFGLVGKLFSLIMSNSQQAKMMRKTDRDASAMGFTEFNRFHHGGKVLEQDVQIIQNCLVAGEQEGRDMSATRKLLELWRAAHA